MIFISIYEIHKYIMIINFYILYKKKWCIKKNCVWKKMGTINIYKNIKIYFIIFLSVI